MSANQIADVATNLETANAQDQLKLDRSSRAAALRTELNAAFAKVQLSKDAADQQLSADQSKASGGFWGAITGILLCIAIVVIACVAAFTSVFTAGGSLVLGAALIGLAAGALASGGAVGGAVGAMNAQGAQDQANSDTQASDQQGVYEKDAEKMVEDLKDQTQSDAQFYQTILQDARKLLQDQDQDQKNLHG
jgi:hypothetical protein